MKRIRKLLANLRDLLKCRLNLYRLTILARLGRIEDQLETLSERLGVLMATQAELVEQVNAATAQVQKIGGETRTLITRVEELLAIIAAGPTVTPELEAAVGNLKSQVQVVDDLVADSPTP